MNECSYFVLLSSSL